MIYKTKEYEQAVAEGRTTHAHGIKSNRAETITVNGVIYSARAYADKHRYNWRQLPNGQIWYYLGENGETMEVILK